MFTLSTFSNGLTYFLDRTPIIMLPIFLLWLQPKHQFQLLFFIYWALNIILNILLKRYIEQPRPSTNLVQFHRRLAQCKDCMDSNEFGMPSGHAQSFAMYTIFAFFVVFSTTSRTHSFPSDHELLFPLLLFYAWILTCFQRIFANRHTVLQVIVGSILGFAVGASLFFFFSDWLPLKVFLTKVI